MDNLIARSGAEARELLENFLIDLSAGLKAARDRGVTVRMPEFVDIEFTYLHTLAAAVEENSQATPAQTETQVSEQPAVTTSSLQFRGAQHNTSHTPAQNTTHTTGGQDLSETTQEI